MADEVDPAELAALLSNVEDGWTRRLVGGASWGVSRTGRAGGRVTTLTADQLGGSGFLSANVWHTADGPLLRPCEVSAAEVMEFLRELRPSAEPER